MSEKIQKILANIGLGSRREIERWIRLGRIMINKQPVKIGDRIDLPTKIYFDGKLIKKNFFQHAKKIRVLSYNKPAGEICTRHDPKDRPTPFKHLPHLKYGRWIMIGRLDIDTSGLLLFTNDGQLANALMHPSSQIDRVYAVRLFKKPDQDILKHLQTGIMLDGHKMCFHEIKYIGGGSANQWYNVTLQEGRNREVKRLWESEGIKVSRLIRIQFGPIILPRKLKRGKFLELKETDLKQLLKVVKINY